MSTRDNITRSQRDRLVRWDDYRKACEEENLDPHSFDMWIVHGEPKGPLG